MLEKELERAQSLTGWRLTTARASLATLVLPINDRYCDLEAIRAGRKAALKTKGAIFDAIVAVRGRNGFGLG